MTARAEWTSCVVSVMSKAAGDLLSHLVAKEVEGRVRRRRAGEPAQRLGCYRPCYRPNLPS